MNGEKYITKKNVYILPASSNEDAIKENQILKRRRELLDEGIPREKLKIRNLELFNDGVKIKFADRTQLT